MLRGRITRIGRVTYFNDPKRREEVSDEMMHAMPVLERKLLLENRSKRFGEDVPLTSEEIKMTNENWLVERTHHKKGRFCYRGAKEEKEYMK